MTNQEYITGIATLISDYRITELTKPLDAAHVERWVCQFAPEERRVVLRETFHILSRHYVKKEGIYAFLDEKVIDPIVKKGNINDVIFAFTQKNGNSQKFIYDYIGSKGKFTIQRGNFTDASKLYIYVDDGLYSEGRAEGDIGRLIELLPEKAHLQVYYMLVYSEGMAYWKEKFLRKAEKKQITIDFIHKDSYINDRDKELDRYDFFWPDQSCSEDEEVARYEKKLRVTNRYQALYCKNENNPGVCSSSEANKQLTAIFLKYGIHIANATQSKQFLPLGFGLPISFGFGAVNATDCNIPNNCPLVLWWGDIDSPETLAGAWYPLLPRRNNREMYEEIRKYEADLSLAGNKDILKTVYRLSVEECRKSRQANANWKDFIENVNISEIHEEIQASELYQYMQRLDMDIIKMIQTVMYIGLDYHPERTSEQDMEHYYEAYEYEEYTQMQEAEDVGLQVEDPEWLYWSWMEDLIWQEGYDAKDIEIDQIYSKLECLPKYMKRAFKILGIQ